MAAKALVNVNIISDLTCPFCWLGKKRLDSSMKKLTDKMDFRIKWLPYQLRPDAPPEGMPVPAEYQEPRRLAQIAKFGEQVGVTLNFSYSCLPNTTLAHTLLDFVASKDSGNKQHDVAEMLFKTHFTDGTMLSEETMVKIGKEAGYDPAEVKAYISNPANQEAIKKASRDNCSKVSGGVPTYYFNGQRMFSGAQDEDVFIRMLTTAVERFPVGQGSKS